jgi:hypothetical protein
MPTLDDLPILAQIALPTGDDLFPIYDLTATGSSKVRKVSLNQINGLSATDFTLLNVTTPTASVTVATRMLRITGSTGNTGIVTASIPVPSGALRDVIVQYFSAGTGGTGSVTLNITGGGTNLFTSAAAAAVSSLTGITSGTTLRLLSDGTNWYRTH